jgi:predicted kinase
MSAWLPGYCRRLGPSPVGRLGRDRAWALRQTAGVLVVMSGLPGSGKSTLADALGARLSAPVISVDPIEAAIWRAGITPSFETGVAAYEVGATIAEHQLRLGLTVIADAANYLEVGRAMWRQAASRAGHPVRVIEVLCSDEALHRRRLDGRQRAIDGFPEPTWELVEEQRAAWEPWPEARLVVDSAGDLDVEAALAYVRGDHP